MQVFAEHLYAAWGRVQRGSPSAGVDGITTELFAGVAQEQLGQIHRQLRCESYVASPAKGLYVSKKSGGQRLIGLSTVRDRILQRYLLQSIYPQLEKRFSESSFAYRPGFSIYGAAEQVMARYGQRPSWVIKADIQQFFDNLSWGVLLGQMERLKGARAGHLRTRRIAC